MPKLTDLSGKQFGRWTVVSLVPETNERDIKWVCECSCGTTKEVSAYPDFYTAEFVSGRTRIIHKDDLELLDKCVDCK